MATVDNLYKVAVIGGALLARGLSLSGVKHQYIARTQEEAEAAINDALTHDEIGLIVLSERLSKKVRDRRLVNLIESSIAPIFVLVPAYNEQEQYADVLRKLIIRAVGIDISAKR